MKFFVRKLGSSIGEKEVITPHSNAVPIEYGMEVGHVICKDNACTITVLSDFRIDEDFVRKVKEN